MGARRWWSSSCGFGLATMQAAQLGTRVEGSREDVEPLHRLRGHDNLVDPTICLCRRRKSRLSTDSSLLLVCAPVGVIAPGQMMMSSRLRSDALTSRTSGILLSLPCPNNLELLDAFARERCNRDVDVYIAPATCREKSGGDHPICVDLPYPIQLAVDRAGHPTMPFP
jgi:hypothetical protein